MIPFVVQVNVVVDYIRPANDDFPERIHCSVTREGMLVLIVSIRSPYFCCVVNCTVCLVNVFVVIYHLIFILFQLNDLWILFPRDFYT